MGLTGPSGKDTGQFWVMLNYRGGMMTCREALLQLGCFAGMRLDVLLDNEGRHAREMVIAEGGGKLMGKLTQKSVSPGKIFVCKTTNKSLLGQSKGQSTAWAPQP